MIAAMKRTDANAVDFKMRHGLSRLKENNFIPLLSLILFLLPLGFGCSTAKNVLIYTRNGKGYVHENIPAGVECLKGICRQNHWNCTVTDDPALFTPEKLRSYDVLVFSNTNNEAFDSDEQRKAFQAYIRSGGGFVGIHSACGSERDWPWFWANLGGKFIRHASFQKINLVVIDPTHPSTSFLPAVWNWHKDECYYLDNLNPDIHVLLAADLTKIQDDEKNQYPGRVFGDYFPVCWRHQFEGGRQWFTSIGHFPEDYKDENFIKHLAGGVRWAMRK
jgi:uncharacterized protein